MSEARVWAPKADRVDLLSSGRRTALAPRERGWFTSDGPIEPGTDYAFALDGGAPRPDPRGRFQPHGVHGPTRAVDLAAFGWTDAGWRPPRLEDCVVYEIHIGTFTPEGTFDGAIEKLPYLRSLGIGAVEVMPVAEFPGERGWGYDGVALYAPHRAYGGPEGLGRFVDACHGAGLAVVLDVVYNHLGPAGNYLGEFGPYFTDRYSTPWGSAVNFDDAGSDEVRRFVIDNALMWLDDHHLDGLRLDAVHAIYDASAVHILEELAAEVDGLQRRLGRPKWLIAESDLNDPRVVTERAAGGYGIDAQWSDDFHHALHAALTGERSGYYSDFGSIGDVARALRQAYVYDGRYSAYRDRRHGRPPVNLPGHRFFGYLQNHDQVGNRAAGERTSMLLGPDLSAVGAALVLTSPFVPMLFQGEEWGASTPFLYFTDHEDPELGRAVTEGRRREFAAFGWDPASVPDPQDPATFERSKLDWDEAARSPHAELLAWHRDLIALRRSTPDLADARLDRVETAFDEDERWLIVRRGAVTVACSFAEASPRSLAAAGAVGEPALEWRPGRSTGPGVAIWT